MVHLPAVGVEALHEDDKALGVRGTAVGRPPHCGHRRGLRPRRALVAGAFATACAAVATHLLRGAAAAFAHRGGLASTAGGLTSRTPSRSRAPLAARPGPLPAARRGRAPRRRCSLHALSEEEASKWDGSPDELFYLLPRVGIYHVDEGFREQLTQLYRLLVPPGGDVVDLCSQHDSHLPAEQEYSSLTVHGMNYLELLANRRATARFTQNFNREPDLGRLPDESADAVLMAVSIQYMQKPVELLRDALRVLRPGGVAIVSFSNRMFFTKAVEAWRSQQSMSGLAGLVQGYFREAGFAGVRAANGVRPAAGGAAAAAAGDPFLAVVGFKGTEPESALELEGVSWLATAGRGSIW